MRTSTSSIMLLPAALTFLSAISAAVVPSAPIQFSDTLTALLSTSDTTSIPPSKDLRKRMIMPDSPPPLNAQTPSSWRLGTTLPVSYRVAIAIDASVLLITVAVLVCLGIYIKRQYTKRRSGLLADVEYDSADSDEEDDGKDVEAGIRVRVVEQGKKKKGHVRWTSSVVGMGVFSELEGPDLKVERGFGYQAENVRGGSSTGAVRI